MIWDVNFISVFWHLQTINVNMFIFHLYVNFSENMYWVSKASLRNWRRLALQKVEVVNKKDDEEQPGKLRVSGEGGNQNWYWVSKASLRNWRRLAL